MPRIGGIKISAKKKNAEQEYIRYRVMGLEERESRNFTRLESVKVIFLWLLFLCDRGEVVAGKTVYVAPPGVSDDVAEHISQPFESDAFFLLNFVLNKLVKT